MPQIITVNDPRPRTQAIILDLSDPMRYKIRVLREEVQETDHDGAVLKRRPTREITREVVFNLDGTIALCDPKILPLLQPIQEAVLALDADEQVAEQARAAAAAQREARRQALLAQRAAEIERRNAEMAAQAAEEAEPAAPQG